MHSDYATAVGERPMNKKWLKYVARSHDQTGN